MRKLTASEHQIQSAYFDLVRMFYPNCKLIYAVPNAGGFSGGFKANVMRVLRLQKEGVTKGVPDVAIDYPRGGFHGARLEFKRSEKEIPTDDQLEAHKQLRENGYFVQVVWDHSQAWELTRKYMRGEITQ